MSYFVITQAARTPLKATDAGRAWDDGYWYSVREAAAELFT